MAVKKLSRQRFEKLRAESRVQRAKLLGWSPTDAADVLGISRQAVHKAIHRGDLDAAIVSDELGNARAYLIPDASLWAFAKQRALERTG